MAEEKTGGWVERIQAAANPQPVSVGFHAAAPDWLSPPFHRAQRDFDLWYIAGGAGAVQLDGAWRAFGQGDLLILTPGVVYERERADPADPFRVYYLHMLPFGHRVGPLDEAFAAHLPGRMNLLHRPEFAEIFSRLFEAYTIRRSPDSLTIKGLCLQLLDVVIEEAQHGHAGRPLRPHPGLLRARATIEARFAEPLSLTQLAKTADMSSSHFSALFHRRFGISPIEHLLQVRVREARLLLARGLRVKEAAWETGFRSASYFSRVFRQRTGMSPCAFAHRSRRFPG